MKLHIPYFNLADGARSTDASLLLEIIILDKHRHYVSDAGDDEQSSPVSLPQAAKAHQQRGRVVLAPPNTSSVDPLAVATLDVQTTIVTKFSSNSTTATAPTGRSVAFTVSKKKGAAGTASLPCQDLPDAIPVSVELTFIKTTTANPATAGEQRVETPIQHAVNYDTAIPAVFVVLTTLFDGATTMNGAEIRLYSRCGDTGRVSKLSSGGRGAIGTLSLVFATLGLCREILQFVVTFCCSVDGRRPHISLRGIF